MARYVLRRLGYSIVVLFILSILVFGISRLSGDPIALMVPPEARAEDIDRLRQQLGLDQPVLIQYQHFLVNALQGDFGTSLWQKQPALQLVLERVPATAALAAAALFLALLIGLPLGMLAAVKRNSLTDRLAMVVAVLGTSIPNFWLGLMLIYLFAVELHWLPSSGSRSLLHLVLPAITLAGYPLARIARLTRSGLIDVLGQDYIRTARAKGLGPWTVIWTHAMRNASISIVTILGLQVGALLGGAVIVETVFAWPGLGQLVVQAVLNRDFPLVQASALFIGTVFVTINLLVDLSYLLLDPRIRLDK